MKLISYALYQLALILLAPFAFFLILRDAKRRDGGRRFILQRFGMYYQGCDQAPIWFHAASLGEVNAIQPLINLAKVKQPGATLLITTSTPAGAEAIRKFKHPSIIHAYLPFDFPLAVRQFLKSYKPKQMIVVETELWPNLFFQAKRAGCAPTIINGRLSHKTIKQRWLYPLFEHCLDQCEMIYTRSNLDHRYFTQLGATPDKMLTVGNIKFAGAVASSDQYADFIERPYLLAASTHSDEEWQVCHALAATGKLIVIVPRHP